ncbi:MAG TPA: hypothetical protein VF793_21835, partial [Telluria sp.]
TWDRRRCTTSEKRAHAARVFTARDRKNVRLLFVRENFCFGASRLRIFTVESFCMSGALFPQGGGRPITPTRRIRTFSEN